MNYRKLTPSMSLLLAFEASARYESFTRAAQELSLTQSAVSRQVRTLESMLDLELLSREGRRIVPTDAGRVYMIEISKALALIREATLQALASNQPSFRLCVATLPTFGSKWLLPRLHHLYQAHPDLQIDLNSRIDAVDFSSGDLDAAIMVGSGGWPDTTAHRLYAEELILIARPGSMPIASRSKPDASAIKLRRGTPERHALDGSLLLRVRSFPNAWNEWCHHFGLPHEKLRYGPAFELTSHLIQAVSAGIGVGLVPRMLVDDELKKKRLVSPFRAVPSSRSYYLVYPDRVRRHPALIAFRDWLLSELVPVR